MAFYNARSGISSSITTFTLSTFFIFLDCTIVHVVLSTIGSYEWRKDPPDL
jgi:hypothetical protein